MTWTMGLCSSCQTKMLYYRKFRTVNQKKTEQGGLAFCDQLQYVKLRISPRGDLDSRLQDSRYWVLISTRPFIWWVVIIFDCAVCVLWTTHPKILKYKCSASCAFLFRRQAQYAKLRLKFQEIWTSCSTENPKSSIRYQGTIQVVFNYNIQLWKFFCKQFICNLLIGILSFIKKWICRMLWCSSSAIDFWSVSFAFWFSLSL